VNNAISPTARNPQAMPVRPPVVISMRKTNKLIAEVVISMGRLQEWDAHGSAKPHEICFLLLSSTQVGR